jgi:hypothetical protein
LFEKWDEVFEKAGGKLGGMFSSFFVVLAYIELGEIEKASSLVDRLQGFAVEVTDRIVITPRILQERICFGRRRNGKNLSSSSKRFSRSGML